MLCSAPRRSITIVLAVTIGITASVLQLGSVAPAGATDATRVVRPGQSIQAAVDAAHPGDRIVVRAGLYAEQVTVAKHGIKLLGRGAVLVPPASPVTNTCSGLTGPDTEAGICVTGRGVKLEPFVLEHRKVISVRKRVRDVRVAGFEVRGFSGANIALVGTTNSRVSDNHLVDGNVYGVLTAGSTHTRISHNVVDARPPLRVIGICADDRAPAVIADNDVAGYNIGLCIQTQGADVRRNDIHNTCIGVYVDPGIGPRIHHNYISATNPVCATEAPYGTFGVLLFGAVGAEVQHNRIDGQTSNGSAAGLAIVDADPPGPHASRNTVKHNHFTANDVDLVVSGTGAGNVVAHNQCDTSTPTGLCH